MSSAARDVPVGRAQGAFPVWAVLLLVTTSAEFASAGERLTDPTRPPSALQSLALGSVEETQSNEFSLSAVLFSKGRRIAVVNDTRVRVGDQIGDAKVLDILPTAVQLQRPDGTFVLSLFKSALRAKSAKVKHAAGPGSGDEPR